MKLVSYLIEIRNSITGNSFVKLIRRQPLDQIKFGLNIKKFKNQRTIELIKFTSEGSSYQLNDRMQKTLIST
jgi:hypothetical protein